MKTKPNKKYLYSKLDLFFARIGGYIFRFWRYINQEISKLVFLFYDAREKSKNLVATNLIVAQNHIINNNLYDAILRYKIILRMDKNNVEAFYGLGFVYHQLGDFKTAISYLERGITHTTDATLKTEIQALIEKIKQKLA